MDNPWLDLPLADYEGHMALPGIEQAQMLSDLLADAIAQFEPQSIAILGCAGGNGFDRIPESVARVVGVDISPRYIAEVEVRYQDRFKKLELIVGDIQKTEIGFAPVDLIFAGLVLEYVESDKVIARMRSWLNTCGHMVTVLQLPSTTCSQVSSSPYSSLQSLANIMNLVPLHALQHRAEANSLVQLESRTLDSAGGKTFQVQIFSPSQMHAPTYSE
ncbi:MAG: methyltransferase type 12 [Proteobacteria bacterium]|nr:methyltransferase type 12 [Pseudomonadota bacterium]